MRWEASDRPICHHHKKFAWWFTKVKDTKGNYHVVWLEHYIETHYVSLSTHQKIPVDTERMVAAKMELADVQAVRRFHEKQLRDLQGGAETKAFPNPYAEDTEKTRIIPD